MSQSKDITVKFANPKSSQPTSRGRMMDFAPRRRPVNVTNTTPVSSSRPQAKSAPHVQVQTTPIAHPQTKPTPPLRVQSRPTPSRKARPIRTAKSASHARTPSIQTTPPSITPLEAYHDLDNYTDFDDLTLGIIEDLDEPLDQRILEQAPEPTPVKPKKTGFFPNKTIKNKTSKTKTPKNSPQNPPKHTTASASPFINTAQLEKRPLSAFRSDAQPSAPPKNAYASRLQSAVKEKDTPTLVTTKASKKSSLGLIITVIIVLILAVIVGGIAYLAFFQ